MNQDVLIQENCTCENCEHLVPLHSKDCPYCYASVGFPNVRAANRPLEVEALGARYLNSQQELEERGELEVLEAFEKVVATESSAVICRTFADLIKGLKPNELFTSFHNQVAAGARLAEDNAYDSNREAVDALLFPQYSIKMNFAALSLNGVGVSYYGDYSVEVKSDAIESRATAFNENTFEFVKRKSISATSSIPAGYKSSWSNRGRLAVAKLGKKLTSTINHDDFQGILINEEEEDADFIEVNIYGSISSSAIKSITYQGSNEQEFKMVKRSVDSFQENEHLIGVDLRKIS